MIIEFIIIAALAVTGIVGGIVTTIRDGYRHVPTQHA